MACRRRSGRKAVALQCARMQKVQAEKEMVRCFAMRSLKESVESMATAAETRKASVEDVSVLHRHEHRSNIIAPTRQALECRNVC